MRTLAFVVCICFGFAVHSAAAAPNPVHHEARVILDPARGAVTVNNTMLLEAEGRVALRLNAAFIVETLSVDDVRRTPNRQADLLFVDLGSPGQHTVRLKARADLSSKVAHEQPPFLGLEGGFLGLGWLGNPRAVPATYRIDVETPLPQIAVMPGRLKNERRANGVYRATFSSDVPDDAPVLITGPFNVTEQSAGAVRVRTYFHDELAPLANGYLRDAVRYIDHYDRLIGTYPHAGFAIVSGPVPIGIGLPGMTYMGRRVLALPFIRATSLPHEVLHNWWGNGVFVDYESGNWAEGLTTYLADHAQSASQNTDGGASIRLEWLRNFAALPAERDRPVTEFTSKTHDASQVVGYGKVGFVFHMLKVRLGAGVFNRAIQRFYTDNRARHAGWDQVRAAFEAESGADLSAFFETWLTRKGAPVLSLEEVSAKEDAVTFTLRQTQDGPAFPLVVPVDIKTDTGTERLQASMTTKAQTFRFTAPGRPLAVSADPDFDVFRRLSADETPPILRDVSLNPATRLVTPGEDRTVQKTARALAEAVMQGPLAAPGSGGPEIVAGLEDDVLAYLRDKDISMPSELTPEAQAKAFVARTANGYAVLVVWAKDAEGLEAIGRVLPHYKRRSYVVMNDGQVTNRGTWPPPPGPLTVRLDGS